MPEPATATPAPQSQTRDEKASAFDSKVAAMFANPEAALSQAQGQEIATQTVQTPAPEQGQPAATHTLESLAAELFAQDAPVATPVNEYQAPSHTTPPLPSEPVATEPTQLTPDQVQRLIDRRVQEQLWAAQQAQLQMQQQHRPQPTQAQVRQQHEQYMQEIGMNPADPVHRVAYEQGIRLEQMQSQYNAQLQQMQQQMQAWQQQARQISVEEQVGQRVTSTLNSYGQVPDATRSAIRNSVASAVMAGVPEADAIRQTMAGYAPLLQMLRGTPQPPAQRPATNPVDPSTARQIAAVATGGRGGGRTSQPNVGMAELESILFGNGPVRRRN